MWTTRCLPSAFGFSESSIHPAPSPHPLLPSHLSVYRNVMSISMSVNKIALPRRRKELPRATGGFAFACAAGATAFERHYSTRTGERSACCARQLCAMSHEKRRKQRRGCARSDTASRANSQAPNQSTRFQVWVRSGRRLGRPNRPGSV